MKLFIQVFLYMLLATPALAVPTVWLGYNVDGDTGTTYTGWNYSTDLSGIGVEGYSSDNAIIDASLGLVPRIHEKTDYSGYSEGRIDSTFISPSTSTGNSFRVENVSGSSYRPSYYVYEEDGNFGDNGIVISGTNRMDMYVYFTGLDLESTDQTTITAWGSNNTQLGTYTCEGEHCREGGYDEGWHYYHYLKISNDIWWHVQYNQTPEHARQSTIHLAPTSELDNYFWHMSQIYFESVSTTTVRGKYWMDEISFDTVANENEYLGSVGVGYDTTSGKWQITWTDNSFAVYTSAGEIWSYSTFDIRWSTSVITNENFDSANPIDAEYWSYFTDTVRRAQPNYKNGWTQFELPNGTEANNSKIYFAIKDISVLGSHVVGSKGDGHTAPSSLIRTIDYSLSAATVVETCSDGILNQDETGIDCGGSCSGCTTTPATTSTIIGIFKLNGSMARAKN